MFFLGWFVDLRYQYLGPFIQGFFPPSKKNPSLTQEKIPSPWWFVDSRYQKLEPFLQWFFSPSKKNHL